MFFDWRLKRMVPTPGLVGGNNDTGGGSDDQARHTLACFLKAAETLTLPPEAEDEALLSPRGQHSQDSGDGGLTPYGSAAKVVAVMRSGGDGGLTPYGSAAKVRVRFHIIRTARI